MTNTGSAVDLFGKISFVLGLEVHAPFNGIFKLFAPLFLQQLHRLGILNSAEIGMHDNVLKVAQSSVLSTRSS